MKKIAIQGVKGSFHHNAALHYFNNQKINIIECHSFRLLSKYISEYKVDFGIMAIENSIVGDISQNYFLIIENKLKIIGEIILPIRHQLMALKNQNIYDIKKIISHPMAIFQCNNFLNKNKKIKILEYYDTAGAAKFIYENKLKGIAAIAPIISSDIYKLNILYKNIESNKNNLTRFLILTSSYHNKINNNKINETLKIKNIDKASIIFKIPDICGSLNKILKIIFEFNINITNIKSIPTPNKYWKYNFFIEVTFYKYEIYKKMLLTIIDNYKNIKILGEYKKFKIK